MPPTRAGFTRLLIRTVALACAVLAVACTTWGRRDIAPAAPSAQPTMLGRRPVRVTRADGSVLIVAYAAVVGDSIVGEEGDPPRRVAIAVRDVRRLDELRFSPARTAGVAVGTVLGLVGALTIAVIIALLQGGAGNS